MTKHQIEITLNPACRAVILVDGHDVAPAVAGITLTAGVGKRPSLELELPVDMFMLDGNDVHVRLAKSQADALVALGWTPPGEVCARADAAEQERDELVLRIEGVSREALDVIRLGVI